MGNAPVAGQIAVERRDARWIASERAAYWEPD